MLEPYVLLKDIGPVKRNSIGLVDVDKPRPVKHQKKFTFHHGQNTYSVSKSWIKPLNIGATLEIVDTPIDNPTKINQTVVDWNGSICENLISVTSTEFKSKSPISIPYDTVIVLENSDKPIVFMLSYDDGPSYDNETNIHVGIFTSLIKCEELREELVVKFLRYPVITKMYLDPTDKSLVNLGLY